MTKGFTPTEVARNMAINDGLDWIAKKATKQIAETYKEFGWSNPPILSIGIVEAVLVAYEKRKKDIAKKKAGSQ